MKKESGEEESREQGNVCCGSLDEESRARRKQGRLWK
jgi:hypothetical protein